jgi:hypothetical protein
VGLAIKHRRLDLLWLALDLAVPPLSLLAMGLAAATIISGIARLFGASIAPLAISSGVSLACAGAVLAGWSLHCREQVPLGALLAAPFYVVMKLPIYLAFIAQRQHKWIRTQRDVAATRST